MIFTQIFRYLDDRDAEELRRKSQTDSQCCASLKEPKSQDSQKEPPELKLPHYSLTEIPPRIANLGKTASERFCRVTSHALPCCHADTTSLVGSTAKNDLPPIRRAEILLQEDQSLLKNKHSVQLPLIDSLGRKFKARSRKARSCLPTGKRRVWENSCTLQSSAGKQERENINTTSVAFSCSERDTNESQILDKESTVEQKSTGGEQTNKAKDSIENDNGRDNAVKRREFNGDYHRTSKHGFGDLHTYERKNPSLNLKQDVISTRIEVITPNGSCQTELQPNKIPLTRGGRSQKREAANCKRVERKLKARHAVQCLGIPSQRFLEADALTLASKGPQNRELDKKTLHSVDNTNKQASRLETDQLSRNQSETTKTDNDCAYEMPRSHFDKGRRNAICEALEKTIESELGSSLYEMRKRRMNLN